MAKPNAPQQSTLPTPPAKPTQAPPIRAYYYERRDRTALAAVEVTIQDGKVVSRRDVWQPDVAEVTIGKLERHLIREAGL